MAWTQDDRLTLALAENEDLRRKLDGPRTEAAFIALEAERDALRREVAELRSTLHRTETRYRLIVESAVDYAIIAADLNGILTTWNEAAETVLGWTGDQIIGRSITTIFTPEDVEAGVPAREMDFSLELGKARDERWHMRADGSRFYASGEMMPLYGDDDKPAGFIKILRDRTREREERQQSEARQKLLTRELQHRVKNTLAMVNALANQTIKRAANVQEGLAAFSARLVALGQAHDILTQTSWTSAPIQAIVANSLTIHRPADETRVTWSGPELRLNARQSLALALALHELATNAAKYGALSNDTGTVAIRWKISMSGEERQLSFVWTERGGPVVAAPASRGFGSRLIEQSLAAEFGGQVTIDYPAEGLVCRIDADFQPESEDDRNTSVSP